MKIRWGKNKPVHKRRAHRNIVKANVGKPGFIGVGKITLHAGTPLEKTYKLGALFMLPKDKA